MKIFTFMLLVLSVLFASCDTNTHKATEEAKYSSESEDIKSEVVKYESIKHEDAKPKVVKPKCNVYTEDDFREEFTC